MVLPRILRRIAVVAGATGIAIAADGLAQAPSKYPTKPVRIVVPFSAGSATDITARMIGPKLSDIWRQPVVIENRTGAGGTMAAAMVAKAMPDGHTLLLTSSAFAISAVLNDNLPYDALKDFRGVAQIGATTGFLAVSPALGVKSVKELIALAHERQGKLLFGSAGAGSGIHMTAERFRMVAGFKAVHVGFKGQPEMLIEILAGRIQYGFPSLSTSLQFIRDGRLLALAVVTPKRSPLLPDVPAMVEALPGFERDAGHALLAPAATPRHILNQISKDVAAVLVLPDVKQQMLATGFDPAPTTPEEYDRILRSLIDTFSKVVRAAGLRAP
ncbi:MAG TPA: tripartite tricarboxylate transporter substrate-binding protein [Burkholderiales bacterium]|nr:tripartite tricarboxylate transporter substrate-binding protein [Burkholderiales bacterium]